jgi:hypothetical protein
MFEVSEFILNGLNINGNAFFNQTHFYELRNLLLNWRKHPEPMSIRVRRQKVKSKVRLHRHLQERQT